MMVTFESYLSLVSEYLYLQRNRLFQPLQHYEI